MITKLGSVIREYSVRNKSDEEIPVYSVTNEQGFCTGYFSKDVASKDRTAYKIVPRGYFAYNPSRINVGSVDWQDCEDRVIVSPLYVVFSVDAKLDQQYLLHYLKSEIARTYIKAMATGSVRDNLKFSILQEFPINLRPLEEQRKIASVLDCLESMIALRKEELETLECLIKSRFIELFGDPLSNYRGWSETDMKAVCKKITDGEHGSVARVDSGNVFLNAKHIKKDGAIDWQAVTYTSDEVHNKIYARCNPEPGDILLTTTGTIGNVAIVPDVAPFSMDRGITLLKLNGEKVNNTFIASLLRFEGIKAVMNANVHASAIGHLFLNQVMKIPVIVPPIELQEQFAAFVEQTDKSKLAVQQGLQELEILKKSLMQQYFG